MAPPAPRKVALRVLRDLDTDEGRPFSNAVLSRHLERHPDLSARDRGLTTTLVYGVLRHQRRLDLHIDAVADKPRKIKGELRTVLRLAAFELLELDRPLGIAAAEANKIARSIDPRGRLRGLLTAVLAGIDRGGAELDAKLQAADAAKAIRDRWSLPAWLATRWVERLGDEAALARARALAETPAMDLRVDTGRASSDEVRARLCEEHPTATLEPADPSQPQWIRARGGGDLFYGPLFEEGLISIQALGSQQAVRKLAPQPGERVLDACAGMGTKTIQIAESLGRTGTIVAADPSQTRLDALEAARGRARLDVDTLEVQIVQGSILDPTVAPGPFDAILVDAPCSGLGNLARHPEIRGRATAGDLEANAEVQRGLLRAAVDRLAPEGRIVYAVCSLEDEEGAGVVNAVLDAGAALEVVDTQRWTPETHDTDGFYLAELRRT